MLSAFPTIKIEKSVSLCSPPGAEFMDSSEKLPDDVFSASAAWNISRLFNNKLMRLCVDSVFSFPDIFRNASSEDASGAEFSSKIHVHTSRGAIKYSLNFSICFGFTFGEPTRKLSLSPTALMRIRS